MAWCPFQSNLVATGGGTADRCIKFWNTHTGACLSTIDTGSQVGHQQAAALKLLSMHADTAVALAHSSTLNCASPTAAGTTGWACLMETD